MQNRLSTAEKQAIMERYWRKRDQDPGLPVRELSGRNGIRYYTFCNAFGNCTGLTPVAYAGSTKFTSYSNVSLLAYKCAGTGTVYTQNPAIRRLLQQQPGKCGCDSKRT